MNCRGACKFALTLTVIFLSLFPKIVFSLGFGQIKLSSYLNEPLKAEIELLGTDEVDTSQLVVSLASADDFKKVQLARPFFLTQMKFKVLTENDKSRILVTTTEAIKQPSLEFLVVLSWTEGRLVRGYTLLFDPTPINPVTLSNLAFNDANNNKNLESLFEATGDPQSIAKFTEPPIVLSQAVSIESSNTQPELIASAPVELPAPPAPIIPTIEKTPELDKIETLDILPEPISVPLVLKIPKKWLIGSGILLLLIVSFIIFRRIKKTVKYQKPKKSRPKNIELFDEEIKIKLDLANQYFLIRDLNSAQELLIDILSRGNLQEKEAAKDLLQKISLCH
jgi:FimV-like protein